MKKTQGSTTASQNARAAWHRGATMLERIAGYAPQIIGASMCAIGLSLIPLGGLFDETALQRKTREVAAQRERVATVAAAEQAARALRVQD
jgi:heme exporter protein D